MSLRQPAVMVLNAGSSSLKFAIFALVNQAPQAVFHGQIEGIGVKPHFMAQADANRETLADLYIPGESLHHEDVLSFLLDWIDEHAQAYDVIGVGHRVVHGGRDYAAPMVINNASLAALKALTPLAPLHQPHNLAPIEAIRALKPQLPQVACFDTAFHRTKPLVEQTFGIPRALTAEGVLRYGFHGLSYQYIADSLPDYLPAEKANGRVMVAHLGNGSSMCALKNRQSMASTMGFTALDGLMMGTRTGALDAGVVLYLLEQKHLNSQEITDLLYKKSGLLGVSGISSDMRTLLASDHPAAQEAVELYAYRINRELGSLAATIDGLDVLVFTAGIGEHSAAVRQLVCDQAAWLGVKIDPAHNAANETVISTPDSAVNVLVIPTNEELVIARHTAALVSH